MQKAGPGFDDDCKEDSIWRPVLAVGMAVHGAPNTVICALPPPCLDGFSSAGCRAGDVVWVRPGKVASVRPLFGRPSPIRPPSRWPPSGKLKT